MRLFLVLLFLCLLLLASSSARLDGEYADAAGGVYFMFRERIVFLYNGSMNQRRRLWYHKKDEFSTDDSLLILQLQHDE